MHDGVLWLGSSSFCRALGALSTLSIGDLAGISVIPDAGQNHRNRVVHASRLAGSDSTSLFLNLRPPPSPLKLLPTLCEFCDCAYVCVHSSAHTLLSMINHETNSRSCYRPSWRTSATCPAHIICTSLFVLQSNSHVVATTEVWVIRFLAGLRSQMKRIGAPFDCAEK